MSKEAIHKITLSAIRAWSNNDTRLSYTDWVQGQFRMGTTGAHRRKSDDRP